MERYNLYKLGLAILFYIVYYAKQTVNAQQIDGVTNITNRTDYRERRDAGDGNGKPASDYPTLSYVPKTKFSCRDMEAGYYADLDTDCQVFHICDEGRKLSFLCPNGTIFQQADLICDWWFKVNCTNSPFLYEESAEVLQKANAKRKESRRHYEGTKHGVFSSREDYDYIQETSHKPPQHLVTDTYPYKSSDRRNKFASSTESIKNYNVRRDSYGNIVKETNFDLSNHNYANDDVRATSERQDRKRDQEKSIGIVSFQLDQFSASTTRSPNLFNRNSGDDYGNFQQTHQQRTRFGSRGSVDYQKPFYSTTTTEKTHRNAHFRNQNAQREKETRFQANNNKGFVEHEFSSLRSKTAQNPSNEEDYSSISKESSAEIRQQTPTTFGNKKLEPSPTTSNQRNLGEPETNQSKPQRYQQNNFHAPNQFRNEQTAGIITSKRFEAEKFSQTFSQKSTPPVYSTFSLNFQERSTESAESAEVSSGETQVTQETSSFVKSTRNNLQRITSNPYPNHRETYSEIKNPRRYYAKPQQSKLPEKPFYGSSVTGEVLSTIPVSVTDSTNARTSSGAFSNDFSNVKSDVGSTTTTPKVPETTTASIFSTPSTSSEFTTSTHTDLGLYAHESSLTSDLLNQVPTSNKTGLPLELSNLEPGSQTVLVPTTPVPSISQKFTIGFGFNGFDNLTTAGAGGSRFSYTPGITEQTNSVPTTSVPNISEKSPTNDGFVKITTAGGNRFSYTPEKTPPITVPTTLIPNISQIYPMSQNFNDGFDKLANIRANGFSYTSGKSYPITGRTTAVTTTSIPNTSYKASISQNFNDGFDKSATARANGFSYTSGKTHTITGPTTPVPTTLIPNTSYKTSIKQNFNDGFDKLATARGNVFSYTSGKAYPITGKTTSETTTSIPNTSQQASISLNFNGFEKLTIAGGNKFSSTPGRPFPNTDRTTSVPTTSIPHTSQNAPINPHLNSEFDKKTTASIGENKYPYTSGRTHPITDSPIIIVDILRSTTKAPRVDKNFRNSNAFEVNPPQSRVVKLKTFNTKEGGFDNGETQSTTFTNDSGAAGKAIREFISKHTFNYPTPNSTFDVDANFNRFKNEFGSEKNMTSVLSTINRINSYYNKNNQAKNSTSSSTKIGFEINKESSSGVKTGVGRGAIDVSTLTVQPTEYSSLTTMELISISPPAAPTSSEIPRSSRLLELSEPTTKTFISTNATTTTESVLYTSPSNFLQPKPFALSTRHQNFDETNSLSFKPYAISSASPFATTGSKHEPRLVLPTTPTPFIKSPDILYSDNVISIDENINNMINTLMAVARGRLNGKTSNFATPRPGLVVPPSAGPQTLHSLAIYFANALDNLNATNGEQDNDETTSTESPFLHIDNEELIRSLLTQMTLDKYSHLFKENEDGATTATPSLPLRIGIEDDSENELIKEESDGPGVRQLARVFTEALSAYLEDPETFRKALNDIRPTAPPINDTTEEDDDEVLNYSDSDLKGDQPQLSTRPTPLPISPTWGYILALNESRPTPLPLSPTWGYILALNESVPGNSFEEQNSLYSSENENLQSADSQSFVSQLNKVTKELKATGTLKTTTPTYIGTKSGEDRKYLPENHWTSSSDVEKLWKTTLSINPLALNENFDSSQTLPGVTEATNSDFVEESLSEISVEFTTPGSIISEIKYELRSLPKVELNSTQVHGLLIDFMNSSETQGSGKLQRVLSKLNISQDEFLDKMKEIEGNPLTRRLILLLISECNNNRGGYLHQRSVEASESRGFGLAHVKLNAERLLEEVEVDEDEEREKVVTESSIFKHTVHEDLDDNDEDKRALELLNSLYVIAARFGK